MDSRGNFKQLTSQLRKMSLCYIRACSFIIIKHKVTTAYCDWRHSPGGNGENMAKALCITVLPFVTLPSLLGLHSTRWVGTLHKELGSELRLVRRQCRLLSMEGRLHAPIRRPSEVPVMQTLILPHQRTSEERECRLSNWMRMTLHG